MHRAHTFAYCAQGRGDARAHAAFDHTIAQQRVGLARGQNIREPAGVVANARHIGHQDQLLRLQRPRQAASEQIGIDVIRAPVGAHADGHDHRDEVAREQKMDEVDVDAFDVPDEAELGLVLRRVFCRQRHLARVDETSVLSVQAHRPAAVSVDESGQLLVELVERHLDHGQRALVGDTQAAMPPAFHAHLAHERVDPPAAAVDDDRLHSHRAQQRDVAREAGLERRIGHRITAETDHQRLAVIRADIRQRLGEDPGFGIGGHCWGL